MTKPKKDELAAPVETATSMAEEVRPQQSASKPKPATESKDPYKAMLDKAGRVAPTGANIIGVLAPTLAAAGGKRLAENAACADDSPVFIDDEGQGLAWAIGNDGRWQPVSVDRRYQIVWLNRQERANSRANRPMRRQKR